jgi:hypothetical protein
MAEAPGIASGFAPWTQRLVETPPWSPLRLALAIAAALVLCLLAIEAAFDRFAVLASGPVHARGDFRLALVMIGMVAYLPGAFAYAVQGARRALEELAPAIRCTPTELAALREEAGRFEPRALRRAGLAGVGLMLLVPLATNLELDTWAVWLLPSEAVFHRLLLPGIGWFGARFVYAVLTESQRLSRIARERVAVDLLDLRPLAPLARQGLRQALLVAGLLSLLSLALIDRDVAPALWMVLACGLAASGSLSLAALALPVRGARAAIIAAKQAELERVDTDLRRAREGQAPAGRSLADLIAWRSLVAAVPEWPFDAPTLLRFALYLAIPLGSWLGGAVVDRLVDTLLG